MPETTLIDALEVARKELARLRRDRQRLDLEIAKMTQVVAALKPVAEPDSDDQDVIGLTDGIRAVLRAAETPVTPTDIRDRLVDGGFNERDYSQFLPAIHVVLKRLVNSGEAMELTDSDRKTYWWSLYPSPRNLRNLYELAQLGAPPPKPPTPVVGPPPGPPPVMRKIIGDSQARRRRLLGKDE